MVNREVIDTHAKDFWKFASQTKGVCDIEDVYMDWAKTASIDINEFTETWKQVNLDILESFGIKNASLKGDVIRQMTNWLFGNKEEKKDEVEMPLDEAEGMGTSSITGEAPLPGETEDALPPPSSSAPAPEKGEPIKENNPAPIPEKNKEEEGKTSLIDSWIPS
jgi:hypothetical protein